MPDKGTMQDHIDDLMSVNKQLRKQRDDLQETITRLNAEIDVLREGIKDLFDRLGNMRDYASHMTLEKELYERIAALLHNPFTHMQGVEQYKQARGE